MVMVNCVERFIPTSNVCLICGDASKSVKKCSDCARSYHLSCLGDTRPASLLETAEWKCGECRRRLAPCGACRYLGNVDGDMIKCKVSNCSVWLHKKRPCLKEGSIHHLSDTGEHRWQEWKWFVCKRHRCTVCSHLFVENALKHVCVHCTVATHERCNKLMLPFSTEPTDSVQWGDCGQHRGSSELSLALRNQYVVGDIVMLLNSNKDAAIPHVRQWGYICEVMVGSIQIKLLSTGKVQQMEDQSFLPLPHRLNPEDFESNAGIQTVWNLLHGHLRSEYFSNSRPPFARNYVAESCWAFQAYAQDNGISRSLLRQVAQIIFDTLAASRNTDMRLHEYTFVQTHKSFPMFRASNIGTAVTADLPRLQALEDDLVLPPLSRSRLAAPGGVTSLAVADIKKLRNDALRVLYTSEEDNDGLELWSTKERPFGRFYGLTTSWCKKSPFANGTTALALAAQPKRSVKCYLLHHAPSEQWREDSPYISMDLLAFRSFANFRKALGVHVADRSVVEIQFYRIHSDGNSLELIKLADHDDWICFVSNVYRISAWIK